MKKSVLLLATLLVATLGIVSYTFLYAGSTKDVKGVDGKDKTECSYSSSSVEDCGWHKRHTEVKKTNAWMQNSGTKSSWKGFSKKDRSKCDWESKHGVQKEGSTEKAEIN